MNTTLNFKSNSVQAMLSAKGLLGVEAKMLELEGPGIKVSVPRQHFLFVEPGELVHVTVSVVRVVLDEVPFTPPLLGKAN